MTTRNVTTNARNHSLTRRQFLTTGCIALSGAAVGSRPGRLLASQSPSPSYAVAGK